MFSLLCFRFLLVLSLIQFSSSIESCGEVIRVSQNYRPADSSLTIGRFESDSYQNCGQLCRRTSLCRTGSWCRGQCTLYREYYIFGDRIADLNCVLITLSGIAFDEVEPRVNFFDNLRYRPSLAKYYEHTYQVKHIDDCVQLCRLDSHCLTASFNKVEGFCSLFGEENSQGRKLDDDQWITIGLDVCLDRDPSISPCFIDQRYSNRSFCDLLGENGPIVVKRKGSSTSRGFLTKHWIYFSSSTETKHSINRISFDLKIEEEIVSFNRGEQSDEEIVRLEIDEKAEFGRATILLRTSIDHQIIRFRFEDGTMKKKKDQTRLKIDGSCRFCFIAEDSSNFVFVSNDKQNFLERIDLEKQELTSISLQRPMDFLFRNQFLWILNETNLIFFEKRYSTEANLQLVFRTKFDFDFLRFLPSHLDVDHFGRTFLSGSIVDPDSSSSQTTAFIFSNIEQGSTFFCQAKWPNPILRLYNSKFQWRILTTNENSDLQLFTFP